MSKTISSVTAPWFSTVMVISHTPSSGSVTSMENLPVLPAVASSTMGSGEDMRISTPVSVMPAPQVPDTVKLPVLVSTGGFAENSTFGATSRGLSITLMKRQVFRISVSSLLSAAFRLRPKTW